MKRQLTNDFDKKLLAKFRSTYHLKINSLGTFKTYKNARNFIVENFEKRDQNERYIRIVIFDRADEVIEAIREKYTNIGTQNSFLSSYKMIYDKSPRILPNPYTEALGDVRQEIHDKPQPLNLVARREREKIKDDFDTFAEGLLSKLNIAEAKVSSFLRKHFGTNDNGIIDIKTFNKYYKRTFNAKAELNRPLPDPLPVGTLKHVNLARAVLAVSVQAGKGHILRGEHRHLLFFSPGGKTKLNVYHVTSNKIIMNNYKTSRAYGVKFYQLRERDRDLIRFIRVFDKFNYIFCAKTGKVFTNTAFNRLYKTIFGKVMNPLTLRKILIDTAEKSLKETGEKLPDTSNSKQVRDRYYNINEDAPDPEEGTKKEESDPGEKEEAKQDEPSEILIGGEPKEATFQED